MKVKRYITTPDKHFPLHDEKAINVVCQAIEIIRPDGYIDLGDVGEWNGCSHWQWKKKKRPPLEIQLPTIDKDIVKVNKWMDVIDESLDKANVKEKYMIEGNHDDWMNSFYKENAHQVFSVYKFKNAVKLEERGYKYFPIGQYLKIGKLNFYHGHHYKGVYHARNHLLKLGANVMYAHHHDIQQHSITHIDGAKSAWGIGCLKNMTSGANTWLGGLPTNWGHAFAIVDFYHSGLFTVHVVQIINGRTSLWGELIQG